MLSASGNAAMRSTWVDNICATPHVVCREVELTEIMVINWNMVHVLSSNSRRLLPREESIVPKWCLHACGVWLKRASTLNQTEVSEHACCRVPGENHRRRVLRTISTKWVNVKSFKGVHPYLQHVVIISSHFLQFGLVWSCFSYSITPKGRYLSKSNSHQRCCRLHYKYAYRLSSPKYVGNGWKPLSRRRARARA